jgi:hypothetical protein
MKSAPNQPVCGAKKRDGSPCQKLPIIGKKRCRLHGGATPKGVNSGTTNKQYRHGLYGEHLTDAEREAWDELPVGVVDNEIKLCRVWLMRAMKTESSIAKAPNDTKNLDGFELLEIRRSTGDRGTNTDAVSKRPDISGRVNWILGRLAQLEKTRAELIAAACTSDDDPDAHARRILDAVAAMNEVEFGEYWDEAPDPERQARAIAKSKARLAREGNGEG